MKANHTYLYIGALALLAASCGRGGDTWSLDGELPSTGGTLLVEAPAVGGHWYVVDSIVGSGNFHMEAPRPNHSTIMRLRLDDATAYFPVDSTESLRFNSADFTVEGTPGADLFAKVEKTIRRDFKPDMTAAADSALKRELLETLSGNYASHAAYYVVRKEAGGRKLLDPVTNDLDYKMLRAVANSFNGLLPADPRTATLVADYMKAEKARRTTDSNGSSVIYAPEIGYYDISLLDPKGTEKSLSSVVDAHKVVVLNFMDFTEESVGLLNAAIGTAYGDFAPRGLEVYQVGFDTNSHLWSNVARNLPWVAVYQSETAPTTHLGQYSVNSLPTTFIIVDGEIVKRVDDLSRLSEELKPYF